MNENVDTATAEGVVMARLGRELGEPTRVAVLDHLVNEGPSGVSGMTGSLNLTGSCLSGHLARLRDAGLIAVEGEGSHLTYRLASKHIKDLVASLRVAADVCADAPANDPAGDSTPGALSLTQARSCYDHLAGRAGVELLDALHGRGALDAPDGAGASIELGPSAHHVLSLLGVELDDVPRKRRRYAFACLDWTERRPHLGGALGAAVLAALLEKGWVAYENGTRALRLTATGRHQLDQRFGISPGRDR